MFYLIAPEFTFRHIAFITISEQWNIPRQNNEHQEPLYVFNLFLNFTLTWTFLPKIDKIWSLELKKSFRLNKKYIKIIEKVF